MATKQSAGKGCMIGVILICVGFFALALVGILAAIAIPTFIKYIEKSKIVESEIMVRKIEDSVKSFYLKECKFPQDAVSSKLPTNGVKITPDFLKGGWNQIATPWRMRDVPNTKLAERVSFYFRYRLVNEGETLKIIADADFKGTKVGVHTLTLVMTERANCNVDSMPAALTSEMH